MNKICKTAFTLSLLVNVLLLGLAAGQVYHHWSKRTWHEMKEDMAPETLALMEKTFRAKHEDIVPLIHQIREQKEELKSVLMGEEFDGRAFDRASRKFESLNNDVLDQKLQTIKILAAELPMEERQKIARKFVASALEGGRKYEPPRYLERMVKDGSSVTEAEEGKDVADGEDSAEKSEGEEEVYIYDLYDMFMMPGEILPTETYGPPRPN